MENTPQRKQQIKQFIERWQRAEGNEDREARSFVIELLQDVLGIDNATRVLDFERRVKGRKIDAFMEDMGILVEAKSRGIDLDHKRDNGKKYGFETPYEQAKWYADNMPNSVRPRWLIVHNFDEFRIHDLELEHPGHDYQTVALDELGNDAARAMFGFFTDKAHSRLIREKELSVEAGAIVGKLYDAFAAQYQDIDTDEHEQRSLNILIVRLVFLLYAEDAGLFNEHQAFYKYMQGFDAQQSRQALLTLFQVLDTKVEERDPYLRDDLKAFPYVNGSLFAEEGITIPQFTEETRYVLLQEASCGFDWSDISPTIFGALFESTLNPETRRAGGMHYTSIENIHKVIDPLFMDDLRAELAEIEGITVEKTRNLKLRTFQNKLASLDIFDPACGSGNFLTESYIQLRKLENRVIESLQAEGQVGMALEGDESPVKVSIDQFYGIEINDFAVSVAKTALWIAESQMLDETQELLLQAFEFFPLSTNAHVAQGNALRMDWNELLSAEKCDYIIGNPPFYGAMEIDQVQKDEIRDLFADIKGAGELDYVTGWYKKCADYIEHTHIRCALVSTNSICQGLPVGTFWRYMLQSLGLEIDFAYQTFVWDSEATDKAHVHVVIIGFSREHLQPKKIYGMNETIEEHAHISPYLTPSSDIFISERSSPISNVPEMRFGSMPRGKGFNVSIEERDEILQSNPDAARYIRKFLGATEFINDKERYCLWCAGEDPTGALNDPILAKHIQQVREERLASKASSTRKFAETPWLFAQIAQPEEGVYLLVPAHSSARRQYLPIGFESAQVICGNANLLVPGATLYEFGVMTSQFHNAWMRTVCGRIKSDYRYSKDIVYNNFIWPDPTPEQRGEIERAAQAILDARNIHPDATLAELYDPDKMPVELQAAHKELDAAVEEAYGVDFDGDEEKIVAHLFKLYADAVKDE